MGDDLRNKITGVSVSVSVRVLGLAAVAILLASCRPERDAVLAAAPGRGFGGSLRRPGRLRPRERGRRLADVRSSLPITFGIRGVDKMKLDGHSSAYVTKIGVDKKLHPDFGSNPTSGIPITFIHFNQKRVKVTFEYSDDSDLGNYPIPPDAKIEGASDPNGDHHILLVDTDRCELFELFSATKLPDGTWKAGSGIQMDLTSNAIRTEGKGSADAAGMPILPGTGAL